MALVLSDPGVAAIDLLERACNEERLGATFDNRGASDGASPRAGTPAVRSRCSPSFAMTFDRDMRGRREGVIPALKAIPDLGRRGVGVVTVRVEMDPSTSLEISIDLLVCELGETTFSTGPRAVVDGGRGDFRFAKSDGLNLKPWGMGSLDGVDNKVEFDGERRDFSKDEVTWVLSFFVGPEFPANPNLFDIPRDEVEETLPRITESRVRVLEAFVFFAIPETLPFNEGARLLAREEAVGA